MKFDHKALYGVRHRPLHTLSRVPQEAVLDLVRQNPLPKLSFLFAVVSSLHVCSCSDCFPFWQIVSLLVRLFVISAKHIYSYTRRGTHENNMKIKMWTVLTTVRM